MKKFNNSNYNFPMTFNSFEQGLLQNGNRYLDFDISQEQNIDKDTKYSDKSRNMQPGQVKFKQFSILDHFHR